jgi:hypothetical protein
MMETLYRHDPRGKSFENLEATEYYQCRIDQESRERRHVFFVRETHGYFDDQQKKPANITETFNPEKPFENFAEAEGRYHQQLQRRASEGFVHAFSFDPFTGIKYRLLAV